MDHSELTMRKQLATALQRMARWIIGKEFQNAGGYSNGTDHIDAYRKHRKPNNTELLDALKNTVYTCIAINSAVCASLPPKLYVATDEHQAKPKCPTKAIDPLAIKNIRANPFLHPRLTKSAQIEEVIEHPALESLNKPNPIHSSFDLWELTTLYQEAIGYAIWLIDLGPFNVPSGFWPLAAHLVKPVRLANSMNVVDYYEYAVQGRPQRFPPERIIHFRYPDPKDPYTAGLAPLQACFETSANQSEYLAFKRSTWDNAGLPSAIMSPEEFIGEEERERLEEQLRQKFTRGGNGKYVVAQYGMKTQVLQHSMGDMAALAEHGATIRDIANAFGVPMSLLSPDQNLANVHASEAVHMRKKIRPCLQRRDHTLNATLIPLYDTSKRLFFASPDPVPENLEMQLKMDEQDLKFGVTTINERRARRGESPVEWGYVPWLPGHWIPADQPRANVQIIQTDNVDIPDAQ